MTLPLDGVRALDLSRVLAGPLVAQMLGDLGAEVIKIEKPGDGDDSRSYGPPFLNTADGRRTRESAFYLSANRNKRSVTVDFGKPQGQDIVRRIAQKSDVVIENFRVGALAKFGLDYAALSKSQPSPRVPLHHGLWPDGPHGAATRVRRDLPSGRRPHGGVGCTGSPGGRRPDA